MEKLTKQITIGIADNDQCAVSVSPDMDAATAFQLVGTLTLHLLNAYTQVANAQLDTSGLKAKDVEAAKLGMQESMYDAVDTMISNVLNQYYPNHPRYSLEDEAILELTNKKIEDRYNAMSKADRARYAQAYNKMKLQLDYRLRTQATQSTPSNDADTDSSPSETA